MIRPLLHPLAQLAFLTGAALASVGAHAAPVLGAADASFYNTQDPSGSHGDLISYRPAKFDLGPKAPAANAWNVLYQSIDALDFDNVVSGTVFVPKAAWTGEGPRPVILYAIGTHGLAVACAPSRQFETGADYENANIAAALKAGYAVLVTDYEGYLTGGLSPTYIAGASQGHAVLDIFKAASAIPQAGISASAPAAIWGFSQGGQSAAWAAEQMATYVPDLKVVGVAAGGIPSDLFSVSRNLNANAGFAFLGMAINGLHNQYDDGMPINLIANDAGKAALAKISTECVFKALFEYQNTDISPLTMGNQSLDALLAVGPVKQTLLKQRLGKNKIGVPFYEYHGQADEFIPLDQALVLKKDYCAKFTDVTFDLYPSEHIVTQFQAAPNVLSWLGDRFAGKPTQGSCNATLPDPTPTANPGGGNLVVSLKQWPLNAVLTLKALRQDIKLPLTSTFTAESDVTGHVLKNGSIVIPTFTAPLKVSGLPVTVTLDVTQSTAPTGSVLVDDNGLLHVHGKALLDIKVTALRINRSQVPLTCKTSAPVEFPLDFDGPISSLGNGNLTFTGKTTIPPISGCNKLFSAVLGALMSGPGQAYTFTVSPPAPVRY